MAQIVGQAFAIRSRRVILPDGEWPATLVIDAGHITDICAYESRPTEQCEDLHDLVILPGLIDPHVHINEPGRADWEGFETATRAAAAGGFTLIADMPLNSSPVTTTIDALEEKRCAATGKLTIDVALHGGLIPTNHDQLPALLDAGVTGIKAFLCHSGLDDFPNAAPDDLRRAMPLLAERGVPLLVHAELVSPAPPMNDRRNYDDFINTRPRRFEHDAIALLIDLCKQTGTTIHIVHLADADCLPMLIEARAAGLPITVETCPHYLYFDPQTIPDGATEFKCAPPIRGDGPALLSALRSGHIDMIASDHSPCPPQMKQTGGRLDLAWGGVSSLQLGASVIRSLDGVTPTDIAHWMSRAPADLLGVSHDRGTIAIGKRADLAVMDWHAQWTVDPAELHHRHRVTPYANHALTGRVVQTYLAGRRVYDRGDFDSTRHGSVVLRHG